MFRNYPAIFEREKHYVSRPKNQYLDCLGNGFFCDGLLLEDLSTQIEEIREEFLFVIDDLEDRI